MSLFYGALINPESLTSLKALSHSLMSISPDGIIEEIIEHVDKEELPTVLKEHGWRDRELTVLQEDEFLMPGFIDTHTVGFLQIPHDCLLKLLFNSMPCNSPPLERQ